MTIIGVISTVLIGLGLFLILRLIAFHYLSQYLQRKILDHDYDLILNADQFRVKGKYE